MDLSSNATIRSTRSRTNSWAWAAAWSLSSRLRQISSIRGPSYSPWTCCIRPSTSFPSPMSCCITSVGEPSNQPRSPSPATSVARDGGLWSVPTCITPTRGTCAGVEGPGAEQAPTRPAHRITLSSARADGHVFIGTPPLLHRPDGDYSNDLDAQREDPGSAEVLSRPLAGGACSRQKEQWPGFAASSRRVAPAGMNWTATVCATAPVSFRIRCTSPPPTSTNELLAVFAV